MCTFQYDDGGRAAAGYRGDAGDCVVRAIAIASGLGYQTVYDRINVLVKDERPRSSGRRSSARTGVFKPTTKRLLTDLGWRWTPTMLVGSGCKVHLRADELPPRGTLVVHVSRHVCCVINCVVHDTYDPRRDGNRCVYGYWSKP